MKTILGRRSLGLLVVALFASGCGADGPQLGKVNGRVILDGQPLPNAFITFTPEKPGRPSMAKSDTAGQYELRFNPSKMGALVGQHQVRVSTADVTFNDKKIPELVPAKYNLKGSIPITVGPKANHIDLDLKSL